MNKKKVLIVEDRDTTQSGYRASLQDDVQLLQAFTIEQAREIFGANPDIDLIVMDGCVPGFEINTPPLVREFRKTFRGPIIATSSSSDYRQELMLAGCSHEVGSKGDVPDKVLALLSL